MHIFKNIFTYLKEWETLRRSLLVCALLVIVLLVYQLAPVYQTLLSKFLAIIRPFVIGFMIAYVLNPLVSGLSRYGIKKSLAIVIVYVALIFGCLFLVGVLLPTIVANISELSLDLIATARRVSWTLLADYDIDVTQLTDSVVASLRKLGDNLSLVDNAISTLTNALGYLTNGIIYLVISLYMLSGFDRIKCTMKRLSQHIHPYFASYLASLDYYMHAFLKGMGTLMLIRMVEYSFMYLVIGHVYWKEMAVFSAVSVFFPYLGPLVSSVVGILTGFGLPAVQFVVMIILLCILFFVDTSIILPDVYSKETNTHPIWIMFAMITGFNLFGFMGILLAIPVFIVFRVAYLEVYFFNHEQV